MTNMIFDVDTQHRTVKDYRGKGDNIVSILQGAIDKNVVVSGSLIYDGDLDVYEDKLPDTIVSPKEHFYVVPNNNYGIDIPLASDCTQVYFEKESSDIWSTESGQPNNLATYVRSNNINSVYVIGYNEDSSIEHTLKGFINLGCSVNIVTDAIIGLEDDAAPIYEMVNSSEYMQFTTTDEVKNNLYK